MTKTIHEKISKIDEYLISITKNVDTNLYEVEIGLRPEWSMDVVKSTKGIEYDVLSETENGSLVKVFSKSENNVIDDLIFFIEKVIDRNIEIAKKEEEFQKKIEEQKKVIENTLKDLYSEIEKLKEVPIEDIEIEEKKVNEKENDNSNELTEDDKKELEEHI